MKKLQEEPSLEGMILNHTVNNEQILNNEIYFYNEVTAESTYSLIKSLQTAEKNCLSIQMEFGLSCPPPIRLYINSEGGELFSSLSVVDRINDLRVPVHTYVEGIVASAASLISISGTKRYMRKNAIMMIHQLRTYYGGTHENVKDETKNLELMSNIINEIYLKNSNFEIEKLEEQLKRDLYLSAEDCLNFKLIDEII